MGLLNDKYVCIAGTKLFLYQEFGIIDSASFGYQNVDELLVWVKAELHVLGVADF